MHRLVLDLKLQAMHFCMREKYFYVSGVEAEVAIGAAVAVPADDVRLAAAVAGEAVADGQVRVGVEVGADRVALAGLAARRVAGFPEG